MRHLIRLYPLSIALYFMLVFRHKAAYIKLAHYRNITSVHEMNIV